MSAKHTPGPWKLEGSWSLEDQQLGGWISTAHPSPLFSLEPITGTPESIIADANLIAAAPELLAALKSLLPQLLPDALAKDKGGLTAESRQRCMAIVKDAIAKSEGK